MNKLSIKSIFSVYLILTFIGIAICRLKYGIWNFGFQSLSTVELTTDFFIGIGVATPVIILSSFSLNRFKWAREMEKIFSQVLAPIPVWKIFVLAISSSVGEEIFFRAGLQSILGLTITSILFGLVHFPFKKILIPWSLMAMVMGFIFGTVFILRGSLIAPIVAHFTINFVNILILNIKKQRGESAYQEYI